MMPTSPMSLRSGCQIHMPLPWGISGPPAEAGGGMSAGSVVVVVELGGAVPLVRPFAWGGGGAGLVRGVTPPAGIGWGAAPRGRAGRDGAADRPVWATAV